VRYGKRMTTKRSQRSGDEAIELQRLQTEHVVQRAVPQPGQGSLTFGSVTDVAVLDFFFATRYRAPFARMIHGGGSVIPHLQDNQQYNSFPPCPYGLTGDKANKLASITTRDRTDAQREVLAYA
jgi:hypothetical protein